VELLEFRYIVLVSEGGECCVVDRDITAFIDAPCDTLGFAHNADPLKFGIIPLLYPFGD